MGRGRNVSAMGLIEVIHQKFLKRTEHPQTILRHTPPPHSLPPATGLAVDATQRPVVVGF